MRYLAAAFLVLVAVGIAPSCSIDQTTSIGKVDSDAGLAGAGGGGGFIDGGWGGYGASGGDAPCGDTAPGTHDISDLQFVYHAYQTLLARAPDPVGFEVYVDVLRSGGTRTEVYEALANSKELGSDPALQDKAGFVERLYGVLLGRTPTDIEGATTVGELKEYDGSGAGTIAWYEAFTAILASDEYAERARPLAGVHFPLPVDPQVAITDADFVRQAFKVLLDRDYDLPGFDYYLTWLQTQSRPSLFLDLLLNAEVSGNPVLQDKAEFVNRAYQVLLGRAPDKPETDAALKDLQKYDGTGGKKAWYNVYADLIGSAEFKTKTCRFEYFIYDEPLQTDTPLLRELMDGAARILPPSEATPVTLSFASESGVTEVQDQKLVTFLDASSNDIYAISRGKIDADGTYNLFLFHTQDALATTFVQTGGPLFSKAASESYYDPQLAIDNTVCPRRYLLSFGCNGDLCTSHTTTPLATETWSRPQKAVNACTPGVPSCAGHYVSPIAGAALLDHGNAYFGWTSLDDGPIPYDSGSFINNDDGFENASSSAVGYANVYGGVGVGVQDPSQSLLAAEPNPKCSSAWDCDSRSVSDWRMEGAYYYLLYAGASYYRCQRPDVDSTLPNQWGVALARSSSPLGPYDREPDGQVLFAERADTCGIGYPVVNAIQGRLFVYYAHHDAAGGTSLRRAPIQCN